MSQSRRTLARRIAAHKLSRVARWLTPDWEPRDAHVCDTPDDDPRESD